MQNRNNLVALCALNLVLFLCCLPSPWLYIWDAGSGEGPGQYVIHSSFTSSIVLLVSFPCWLLLVGSILSGVMTLLNLSRITTLSWKLPLFMLLFSGAYYGFLLFNARAERFAVGPVIALVNSVFTLLVMDRVQRFLKLEAEPAVPSPTAPARAPGRTRIGQRKWTSGNN